MFINFNHSENYLKNENVVILVVRSRSLCVSPGIRAVALLARTRTQSGLNVKEVRSKTITVTGRAGV
jgi:hypothetical protein